jgi:Ca2+-binding EF-hand superfamily protein
MVPGCVAFAALATNFLFDQQASSYYNQVQQQELFELQKWFNSVDKDRSGDISANELANVAVGGIRLGIDLAIKV